MIFFMLTNILTESTSLLCEGEGAEALIRAAFHMEEAGADDEANVVELSLIHICKCARRAFR